MHFLNFRELQTKMTGNRKVVVTSGTVKWPTVTVATALQLCNAPYVEYFFPVWNKERNTAAVD
jgi:hypothetical protein